MRKTFLSTFPFWCIPMIYSGVTILLGLVFPHLEYRYLAGYNHGVTVPVAIAVFSSIAQGMLALTAIVFSLAFVMVQFSSTAYSPRLILWLSRDPIIWHSMGLFTATFLYSLVALFWVDRWGDGRVPFVSGLLVLLLLIASIMVISLLVQRLALLQVAGVMRFIGEKGRHLIMEIYPPLTAEVEKREIPTQQEPAISNLPLTQKVVHTGEPMAIAAYNVEALVNLAKQAEGLIIMPFAVGDVVVEGEALLTVHGSRLILSQLGLRAAVHLEHQRTFDQDPKYAIRLLVDIAIKALSPAVNDSTTAVQALNQIEDLLRRLGARDLEVGQVRDETGVLRLAFPTPTWEDFLMLAFDEIRFYGTSSLQVMRRLRTSLYDIADALPPQRQKAIRHYIEHLDIAVKDSIKDTEDQATALQQDRQGLGLSRGL